MVEKDPFVYHKPTFDQASRMETLNNAWRSAYNLIVKLVPESPERTLAIRKLQETRMWANCAIVLNEE